VFRVAVAEPHIPEACVSLEHGGCKRRNRPAERQWKPGCDYCILGVRRYEEAGEIVRLLPHRDLNFRVPETDHVAWLNNLAFLDATIAIKVAQR